MGTSYNAAETAATVTRPVVAAVRQPARARVHRKSARWLPVIRPAGACDPLRDALAHEVIVAKAAARLLGPKGARLAPRVLAVEDGIIVSEWLDGHETLHALLERSEAGEAQRADHWGTALALLHGASRPTLPPAMSAIPRPWEMTPQIMTSLPAAGLEIVARLQTIAGIPEALDELAATAPSAVFVHGDAKLDNAMWGPRGELRLVDWELGGLGDSRWDLGSALGDYLARWIASAQIERGRSLRAWMTTAKTTRSCATLGARAVLDGYERTSGQHADRRGVARYVGVFFLHRAQAWGERAGRLGARATLLAAAGERLIMRPQHLDSLLAPHGR